VVLALAALGLSMIFGTTGLTNFGHGELITFGAIAAWYLNDAGLPFVAATLIAVLLGGLFGLGQDTFLWNPLRRRKTGLISMMIVSIGLAIFLRYTYLYIFGGSRQSYREYTIQTGSSSARSPWHRATSPAWWSPSSCSRRWCGR
jgi:neutral amino acid transport system permease protein